MEVQRGKKSSRVMPLVQGSECLHAVIEDYTSLNALQYFPAVLNVIHNEVSEVLKGTTQDILTSLLTQVMPLMQRKIMSQWRVLYTSGLRWCQRRYLHKTITRQSSESTQPCMSAIKIQMLSENLHQQIFPERTPVDQETVNLSLEHLRRHNLLHGTPTMIPDVSFKLPKLQGRDIDEHFRNIAQRQTADYVEFLNQLKNTTLPPQPKEWCFRKGWTRYDATGTATSVDYPEEETLVFDIECLMNDGSFPTLATAAGSKYWYSWCSDYLIEDKFKWSPQPQMEDLIPLESKSSQKSMKQNMLKKRIIVGHNVGFDRSFVKEQYYIKDTKLRFLDTMSLHIASVGFTAFQRSLYQASKKETSPSKVREHLASKKYRNEEINVNWMDVGTMNNLNDVYQFHCNGEPLEKSKRDVFINGTMLDVREDFQSLMSYCSKDVIATHDVFTELWPKFLSRFPHPVTLSGMLEMGNAYLPINQNWELYKQRANDSYNDYQRELKLLLIQLADTACELLHNNRYKDDVWLWDLDWSVAKFKTKKLPAKKKVSVSLDESDDEFETVFQKILLTASSLYKRPAHKPGYPEWYRKLCPRMNAPAWEAGPSLITPQLRITPKLLRLTWDGYPVHFDDKYGWGYLVPKDHVHPSQQLKDKSAECPDVLIVDNEEFEDGNEEDEGDIEPKFPIHMNYSDDKCMDAKEKNKHWRKAGFSKNYDRNSHPAYHTGEGPFIIENIPVYFFKIPHKDGKNKRVGNILAKDYLNKVTDGTLRASAGGDYANAVLLISKLCSYWKNNQKRIESQMVVWAKHSELPPAVIRNKEYSVIKQYGAIVPRIVPAGTVTRRAVEPTWLTASNAYKDRIGSELKGMVQSPPGYCFVGADVDSQELWLASLIGDSFFTQLHGCTALSWMTLQGKKSEGTDMHSKTAELVGISRDHAKVFNYSRIYGAGHKFAEQLLLQFNHRLSYREAQSKIKKLFTATKGNRDAETGSWVGGSESFMFNKLEEIARDAQPVTPVLGCRISEALEPEQVSEDFMNSRINWAVQSSAVDYLHLMLVSMKWLLEEYSIDGRFSISIHDEVRYLVRREDRYRAALALQITNLFTRCLCAHKLGIPDLPQSVAFFSAVDIDTCLRKEVDLNCVTPSNPHGLETGYNIPFGKVTFIK
ncbi:DNA polymerase subunit gamma-1-like [Octopus vulgaris]|uniref:DNA polymerase subunit gamma-1 n=1 Tax=Octopus vulgaris TaxID=6645 RepID=A0AA36ANF4_OCTVU|nr:DNA polymerase subunit gamma-1-like [Octopus vulgaris]